MSAGIVSSSMRSHPAFMTTGRVFTAAPGAGGADHAGGVCPDSGAELAGFNGEANSFQGGCPPAGCDRNSRTWPGRTGGRAGCGPGPTSPARPAGLPISVPRQYIE